LPHGSAAAGLSFFGMERFEPLSIADLTESVKSSVADHDGDDIPD
jgi:hypothetical protein